MLGCDGIFDSLTNNEVSECVWLGLNEIKSDSIHLSCAAGCDMIMKTSLIKQTFDNISCIVICFENYENTYNKCNNVQPTPDKIEVKDNKEITEHKDVKEFKETFLIQKPAMLTTEGKFPKINLLNLNGDKNNFNSNCLSPKSTKKELKEFSFDKRSTSNQRFETSSNNINGISGINNFNHSSNKHFMNANKSHFPFTTKNINSNNNNLLSNNNNIHNNSNKIERKFESINKYSITEYYSRYLSANNSKVIDRKIEFTKKN